MTHVHLIGIGGAGLSAIAGLLIQQGNIVSGSDMHESENVARLRKLGAQISIGHRAENITAPDAVVFSSAIPAHNPELIAAREKDIPTFKRPAWLGEMMHGKRGICIAGAHGKSTTTAMLAYIFNRKESVASFIVGTFIPQLNTNAAAGKSNFFIIEADEYDRTFLSLKPEIALITNIERDHPDTYPTDESLNQAFVDFATLVPESGTILVCGDDAGVKNLRPLLHENITFGIEDGNLWQARNIHQNKFGGFTFDACFSKNELPVASIALRVPGLHNVKNALGALVAAITAGIDADTAAAALSNFRGTARRFEIKGEASGVTVIDDYAHNPTELKATLSAARAKFGKNEIWAIFQPHTFSRTKLLLTEFATAFDSADHVILLDIYPAREKDDGTISSTDILAKMQHSDARYIGGDFANAVDYLKAHLSAGDALITLGAGDGNQVGEMLLEQLR